MTILEPILYANGALRLTRHGAGKGGNVLVINYGDRTDQCELTDEKADHVEQYLNESEARRRDPSTPSHLIFSAATMFATIKAVHSIGARGPNFYHD